MKEGNSTSSLPGLSGLCWWNLVDLLEFISLLDPNLITGGKHRLRTEVRECACFVFSSKTTESVLFPEEMPMILSTVSQSAQGQLLRPLIK